MRTFATSAAAADFTANLVLAREFDSKNDASSHLTDYFEGVVGGAMLELGVIGRASAQGSIAKGTNLGGSDIDIFMVLPRDTTEDFATVAARVAERIVVSGNWMMAHVSDQSVTITPMVASHPYVVLTIKTSRYATIEVDIVPCYDVPADAIVSAVDRTPHHTRFMNENLTREQKQDVRKLKLLLKGMRLYGADVWTGGFSGYACEVMVHKYGSFVGVLQNAYEISQNVLIDPVDPNRNVLASVSSGKRSDFYDACSGFVSEPSVTFFYPYEIAPRVLPNVLVVKTPAADENAAAEARSNFQALSRSVQSISSLFVAVTCYWKDGHVYAVFSSRGYPRFIERQAPDREKYPEGYRAFVAAHVGVTGHMMNADASAVVIANPHADCRSLMAEHVKDFMPSSMAELGNVCIATTLTTEDA